MSALGRWLWEAVWPNWFASAVWAAPAWLWAHRRFRRLHHGQQALHTKLDAITPPTSDDVTTEGGA